MCVGIPMKIVVEGDLVAECEGRNGRESINMMLLGSQPKGTWILAFLGSARDILTADEAAKIDDALDALEAVMSGAEVNLDDYFADLVDKDEIPPKASMS